jgi:hypothetical protein
MGSSEVSAAMRLASAIAILCLSFATHSQGGKRNASPEAMPLCEVIANSSKYDGKLIEVAGLYRFVIHGAILMDRSCPQAEINLRESPGYKADKKAASVLRSITKEDQFQPVDVILRGILHVAHDGQCFGEMCAAYQIEITELMTARPAPPEGRGTAGSPPTGTLLHDSGNVDPPKAM